MVKFNEIVAKLEPRHETRTIFAQHNLSSALDIAYLERLSSALDKLCRALDISITYL